MNGRTDLALEAAEAIDLSKVSPEDVVKEEKQKENLRITRIEIKSDHGAELLGKPKGQYITAEVPNLSDNDKQMEQMAIDICDEIQFMLPKEGTILVVGLGNAAVTPDALGPLTADMILATRHIQGEFARSAGMEGLRPTAVTIPGVLGKTGVETSEVVKGLCETIKPAAVIAVDALAARSLSRLGKTVQICNTGISPGSGVGNDRKALNQEFLGIPVIGMGVPTVVDAEVIAMELTGTNKPETTAPNGTQMMVTPREIDLIIERASRLTAMIINAVLQTEYSPLELITVAK